MDGDELRNVMRRWASGVAIVAAQSDGLRHGMTVSSFTSVSLAPPLVVISLENHSTTQGLVNASRAFSVNILDEGEADLAQRFAGGIPDAQDRFAGVEAEAGASGSPILSGGLAYLDCRMIAAHPAGTHTLYIGEVIAAGVRLDGRPLLYFQRDYRRLDLGRPGG